MLLYRTKYGTRVQEEGKAEKHTVAYRGIYSKRGGMTGETYTK